MIRYLLEVHEKSQTNENANSSARKRYKAPISKNEAKRLKKKEEKEDVPKLSRRAKKQANKEATKLVIEGNTHSR